jgi:ribulose-phosphate 3-epimerase
MSIIVAPSLLSADFSVLRDEIADIEKAGAEYLHLDIMDGVFVPNITFGAPVIKCLRKHSRLVFDAHLMIENPLSYIKDFAEAGADIITFHAETIYDIAAASDDIIKLGAKPAASVKPNTPVDCLFPYLDKLHMVLVMSVEPGFSSQKFIPEALPKIEALRHEIDSRGLKTLIQVDGGINGETGKLCIDAGANILVGGSFVFGNSDRKAAIDILKAL